MSFVYRVSWILKDLWTVLSETINILRNLHKQKNFFFFLGGGPWKCYHRFMYIAPSSDHSLLVINLPFKLILRRFEFCFLMSGVGMLHFSKDWWKFIQIHQYYSFQELQCLGEICSNIVRKKEKSSIDWINHLSWFIFLVHCTPKVHVGWTLQIGYSMSWKTYIAWKVRMKCIFYIACILLLSNHWFSFTKIKT